MSLATAEGFKDKNSGEWTERTEWHRVVLFGRQAEVAGEYLRKGSKIYVEGKLQTRNKGGNDRFTTEVVANNLIMLGEKTSSNPASQRGSSYDRQENTSQQQPAQQMQAAQPEFVDDDSGIPF